MPFRDMRATVRHCDALIETILEELTELRVWLNNQQNEQYESGCWDHYNGLFATKLSEMQAIIQKQVSLTEHWLLCRIASGYRTTPAITAMHGRVLRTNRLVKEIVSDHFPAAHDRFIQIANERTSNR